jgi:hypothetical protein
MIARERSEWAGMPLPVKGLSMTVHPSYPFAKDFSEVFCPEPSLHVCRDSDVREDVQIRNSWLSSRLRCYVTIFREGSKFRFAYRNVSQGPLLLNTLVASQSWSVDAEMKALESLQRHVSEAAFGYYLLTGMFLETSKKSGVVYLFRRLRPTLAMNQDEDGELRVLCGLCRHSVGYFNNSWAGAMVPTDEVIAALLLMRGDEHAFWKDANQHPEHAPEAGLVG